MSSNNYSCSTSVYSIFSSCVPIIWVSSWVLSIGLIWQYGSSKRNGFTFGQWQAIVSYIGYVLDVSVFLLSSIGCDTFLWLFWGKFSLTGFLFMNNGHLKGQISSLTSSCIKNYPQPLFLSTHLIQSYFRYGIDGVLSLWKDLGWYCWLLFLCCYCWLVFLWVSWCWFGTLWCWNVLPKLRLTMV